MMIEYDEKDKMMVFILIWCNDDWIWLVVV